METYTFEDYCKGKVQFKDIDKRYRLEADILIYKCLFKRYVMWVVNTETDEEIEIVEKDNEEEALESLIALAAKYSK